MATPAYIFRGHNAAIHSLHFFRENNFFASGDSEGWLVIWRMTTRRAAAVWKAHEGGVSGIKDWQGDRLITHGRDHKLRVWQLRQSDYDQLDTTLPTESISINNKHPWLVHSFDMNALNFCAFAICFNHGKEGEEFRPALICSPNGMDSGGIDVFQLPSEKRLSRISANKDNTGMVMTLRIFTHPQNSKLTIVAGYEDGRVAVYVRKEQNIMPIWIWDQIMLDRPHTQPVLSLDICLKTAAFITSSADATIARYTIPQHGGMDKADRSINTKHSGQQDLKIRSDGRIFATAGWDKHIRIYSVKTLKELAVLQWHQTGCYAISFAQVLLESVPEQAELGTVQQLKRQRDTKIHHAHYLVAGSKDGKISMWEVY